MSVQNIIHDILEKAKVESKSIELQGEEKLTQAKEDFEKEKQMRKEELASLYQEKESTIIEKAASAGDLDGKNLVLKKKKELLEGIFSRVKENIRKNKKSYQVLMTKLLSGMRVDEGTVVPGKGEKELFESIVSSVGKSYTVAEEKNFSGGFIFQSSQADYNFTLDILLSDLQKREEMTLAKNLF